MQKLQWKYTTEQMLTTLRSYRDLILNMTEEEYEKYKKTNRQERYAFMCWIAFTEQTEAIKQIRKSIENHLIKINMIQDPLYIK